jgi:acyl-CoA synthetase (NDP forming)
VITPSVFREFGVWRARTTEELIDVAYLAQKRIFPVRNTLGVITVSGGAGVLISDAAEPLGLALPPMPAAAQARLKARLPYASVANPVDATAQVINEPQLVGEFAAALFAEGGYGSVLVFLTQVGASATLAPRVQAGLAPVVAAHPDRLPDPTRATTAIAAMGFFGDAFAAVPEAPPAPPAMTLPEATPDEAGAAALLARAGIAVAPQLLCATANQAVAFAEAQGFPVVLKLASPDIPHKSEVGGVLLGLDSAEAVRAGFATLRARAAERAPAARITGVLAAKQLQGGVECIIGATRDPAFGMVAMVGLGGVFAEVFADVAHARCPFGPAAAQALIRRLRALPLLEGARGRPPADIPALAQALARLSAFAAAAGPRLRSVEVNPIIVLPAGQGALAADAVLMLEPA